MHHMCKRHVDKVLAEDDVIRLGKAMQSVGLISYSRMTGTVFRAGTKYVMTAAHIVRDIVGNVCNYRSYPKYWTDRPEQTV